MKSLTAALLAILLLPAAAVVFAVNTQFQTRVISTATLTINVKDGVYLTIRNFTQDKPGASGQRGVVVVGVIVTTPPPAPTPTLSTTAGPGVALGGTLNDTAILFGDNNPNGQITFTLLDPTVSNVYTDVVTVNGNGTYTTAQGNHPGGFSPTIAGTYTWTALYTGDTHGNPAATAAPETVIVTATPTPPPTPTPAPTPILAAILAASISNALPAEFVKPIIIAGPATLTIDPVPGATLSITYRKMLQPSGTPTPTPTSTSTPTSTATPTPTVAALSVGSSTTSSQSVTTIESTVSDDEDTFSTPTPTATPTPTPASLPTSTPIATASITPTPTPGR